MQLKDLNPNKKNPRKTTQKRLEVLKRGLDRFGDLSGFVYNRRTNSLISGHQRSKVLPPNAKIKIEVKHERPTQANTIAEGFVEINGERFKYREVDADKTWEIEAMLAANNHAGEFDKDLLRVAVADVPEIDLEVAGFTEVQIPEIAPPKFDFIEPYQEEEKNEYVEPIKGTDEDEDAKYLKENPGPDSEIRKENISTINPEASKSAFQSISETTEILNKRYVIIIDCPDQATKDKLKESFKAQVQETNSKFC